MCRWEWYVHADGGMGECVTMLSVCQHPCETGCDPGKGGGRKPKLLLSLTTQEPVSRNQEYGKNQRGFY